MAKTKQTETAANGDTIALSCRTFNVPVADLSPAATNYLLQYGFAKSLQDSVAGMKAELSKAVDADDKPLYDEAGVIAKLTETMQARLDAILSGTIGTRSGTPRATPFEKVLRDVAIEAIRAAARAKSFSLKGQDLDALVTKYLAKNGEAAKIEATRRLEQISVPDSTFEGLFE